MLLFSTAAGSNWPWPTKATNADPGDAAPWSRAPARGDGEYVPCVRHLEELQDGGQSGSRSVHLTPGKCDASDSHGSIEQACAYEKVDRGQVNMRGEPKDSLELLLTAGT